MIIGSSRPKACREQVAVRVGMFTRCALGVLLAGCIGACKAGAGPGDGQVTPPWTNQCIATFDQDYEVQNAFSDHVDLSILSGEAYLLESISTFWAAIYHMGSDGVVRFEIMGEGSGLPFSSNCSPESSEPRMGVFADTPFYADKALTEELCVLEAGTITTGYPNFPSVSVVPRAGGDIVVYEGNFPTLSELCADVDVVFMEASYVKILDVEYAALPIGSFLTPVQ